MIPSVVSDTSIIFVAKGRPWTLGADHPAFEQVKKLLGEGYSDEAALTGMVDVRVAVDEATEGRAVLTEDGLTFDGEVLSAELAAEAAARPQSMKVLLVKPGDRVRVEGDDEAPDGVYTVGELDEGDARKRVYVESDEDFFGFVSNTSIKEILKDE